MTSELLPPTPGVEHLTTIFRRISKGDIRIPAFQRRLVWDEAQVASLLESVYRGFPIGSALLWMVRGPILRDAELEYPIFPISEPNFPTSYILDGMQRLSSLYGVFNYLQGTSDPRLNMWFNLNSKTFIHHDVMELFDHPFCIPVRSLLSPRELLEIQGRLLSAANGALYVDRLLELQARFQEYMIPIVTITRDNVGDVVEIFERVNTSGTKLDTVDFMRAVTWSSEFDLNGQLDELNASLDEHDFALDEQTLIKLIGLELGKEPLADALLSLRGESSQALTGAVLRVRDGVIRVAKLLVERLSVFSSDFVPYEGQILVLYKALMQPGTDLDGLVKWYWAVGFNEALRGKPDHYVARAVRSVDDLLNGKVRGVEPRLDLREIDLIERRFIQGRALSVTVAGLFAKQNPRSLLTGQAIELGTFMYEPATSSMQHICLLPDVEYALGQKTTSAKVFANLFIPSVDDRAAMQWDDKLAKNHLVEQTPAEDVLASQFLNVTAVNSLREHNYRAFLEERARLMLNAAANLVL